MLVAYLKCDTPVSSINSSNFDRASNALIDIILFFIGLVVKH